MVLTCWYVCQLWFLKPTAFTGKQKKLMYSNKDYTYSPYRQNSPLLYLDSQLLQSKWCSRCHAWTGARKTCHTVTSSVPPLTVTACHTAGTHQGYGVHCSEDIRLINMTDKTDVNCTRACYKHIMRSIKLGRGHIYTDTHARARATSHHAMAWKFMHITFQNTVSKSAPWNLSGIPVVVIFGPNNVTNSSKSTWPSPGKNMKRLSHIWQNSTVWRKLYTRNNQNINDMLNLVTVQTKWTGKAQLQRTAQALQMLFAYLVYEGAKVLLPTWSSVASALSVDCFTGPCIGLDDIRILDLWSVGERTQLGPV